MSWVRARRIVVAIAVAVVPMTAGLAPAGAEVPVRAVGWWTRSPAPPTVPSGGVAVGNAPDGPLTVAAVRIDVGGGATGTTLKLAEAGGQGQQVAAIQACPAADTWSTENGGDLSHAPKASCDVAKAPLARGADGTWSGDVQKLVEGKTATVSLAILPDTSQSPVSAFQISFAAPVVRGSVSTSSSSGTDSSFQGATSSSPATSGFASPTTPPAASFSIPASPSVSPPTTAAPAAATPGSTEGPTTQIAARRYGALPRVRGGNGRSVTKLSVLLWLLIALVVGGSAAGLHWAEAEGRLGLGLLRSLARRGGPVPG